MKIFQVIVKRAIIGQHCKLVTLCKLRVSSAHCRNVPWSWSDTLCDFSIC